MYKKDLELANIYFFSGSENKSFAGQVLRDEFS